MTRLEQQTFVKDLMQSFKRSMDADFMAGRIPEHWTGQQLRKYVFDKVDRGCLFRVHSLSERREYENDCIINNL